MASSSLTLSSHSLPNPSLSHAIYIKLTPENYLLWKTQLIPYLHGQCLFQFVDGSLPPPKLDLPDGTINSAYDTWIQQDQFFISALILSLYETLMDHIVGCTFACEVWLFLESTNTFVSQAQNSNLPSSRMALTLSLYIFVMLSSLLTLWHCWQTSPLC